MSAPETPERLFVRAYVHKGVTFFAAADVAEAFDHINDPPDMTAVVEYVREDVATLDTQRAVDTAVGVSCCRPTHLGGEIGQTDRCGECLVCLREDAAFAAALRRERDALKAEVARLKMVLGHIWTNDPDSRAAQMADEALAAKGVR